MLLSQCYGFEVNHFLWRLFYIFHFLFFKKKTQTGEGQGYLSFAKAATQKWHLPLVHH